jgi:hypothetical protein
VLHDRIAFTWLVFVSSSAATNVLQCFHVSELKSNDFNKRNIVTNPHRFNNVLPFAEAIKNSTTNK